MRGAEEEEEEEEEALPAPGGSERGSRRPKMAAAAGDVCGAVPGGLAGAGAAAEARFISSAKVSPAVPAGPRGAGLPPFPQAAAEPVLGGKRGYNPSSLPSGLGRGVYPQPPGGFRLRVHPIDPRLSLGRGKAYSPPRTSAKVKPSSWRGRWCRPSSSGTLCTTTEVSGRRWWHVPVTCPAEVTVGSRRSCPVFKESVWVCLGAARKVALLLFLPPALNELLTS